MSGKPSRTQRKPSATPHTDRQIQRGDWNPLWNTLRAWDPQFVEGYLTMRNAFGKGPLPDKTKELVLIAINRHHAPVRPGRASPHPERAEARPYA